MGIIPYLKSYGLFDKAISQLNINEAKSICNAHFGVDNYLNTEGWEYILNRYGGYLPLKIYALPAGTIIKPGTPVMAVENTDPKCFWLTNYIESILMHCWAMTTTATISYDIFKVIKKYSDMAGEQVSPFHLNDFGVRGVSSFQSAELNGTGHLAIFQGTDNLPAIKFIKDNYTDRIIAGASVIAAEHSTITSWGKDHEIDAYRHIITTSDKTYNPNTDKFIIISLVCDSYDWRHAVKEYFCKELKDQILNRNGKVVVRPDNGNPPEVTLEILNLLWDSYGGSINKNGYKVLDPHIGVIYADAMDSEGINNVLKTITDSKFAPSNVIFGSGGGLLQKYNRGTLRFAFKLNELTINNQKVPICKKTPGKENKSGRFDLPLIYENGKILITESFTDIRNRIGAI